MSDREAKIKIVAEGASRAASEIRGVKEEVGGIEGVANKAQKAVADVGKALYHMASDAAKAANDVKPISFQAAADSAKKFDETVTRMAVRSGKDVAGLQTRFRDIGKEIGVMPGRVADVARALGKMTGSTDAADAMRALGDEANDTDRSLEDMTELGATLYKKMGVPMDRIGDAIRKVRTVAADFATVGGHIALEDTLVRLAPLLAQFGGGINRAAATVGVLARGKSAEVAQETTGSILGTLEGMDPLLLTKKMRQLTGDRNYKPYRLDAQGRVVQKPEVAGILQKHLRTIPKAALYQFFGRSQRGVQAAETFINADLDAIPTEEARLELQEDARADAKKRAQAAGQHRPGEKPRPLSEEFSDAFGGMDAGSSYSGTAAGRRNRTDVERADVEYRAGEVVQKQRDKRNNMWSGNREGQAAADTLKAYLPSYLERPAEIAEAAAAEANSRGATLRDPRLLDKNPGRMTVDLSPASTKSLADAIRSAPPVVRPDKSPAAQAVEDSKAKHRGAANF